MQATDQNNTITFDCYGTLIDWQTGIRAIFEELVGENPDAIKRIFEFYDEEERRIEKLSYRSYREVVSLASYAAAKRAGIVFSREDSNRVAEEIPRWKPFPDTNPSLEKLSQKYILGILSNIDNDLLSGTLKHFKVKFDLIVTAEDVRSYKPKHVHFQEARRRIGKARWLHAAASLYHDIAPANELGIDSVWVNRTHSKPDQSYPGVIKREVGDLSQLVKLLV